MFNAIQDEAGKKCSAHQIRVLWYKSISIVKLASKSIIEGVSLNKSAKNLKKHRTADITIWSFVNHRNQTRIIESRE
jgi:hypothetical protein